MKHPLRSAPSSSAETCPAVRGRGSRSRRRASSAPAAPTRLDLLRTVCKSLGAGHRIPARLEKEIGQLELGRGGRAYESPQELRDELESVEAELAAQGFRWGPRP